MVVSSYEHFWYLYSRTGQEFRNFYEVIEQSKPVKLYFDLEFNKEANPKRNYEAMIDMFVEEIDKTLESIFKHSFSPLSYIQLDSSSDSKFSQHLIFQNVIFQSYEHCGRFVNHLCDEILMKAISNPSLQTLVIKSPGPRNKELLPDLFVDRGVYTKNRNFRLFLSSKMGKNRPLELVPESPFQELNQRDIFMQSLICNIPDLDKQKVLQMQLVNDGTKEKVGKTSGQDSASTSGYGSSPYPIVDDFIESIIAADGSNGRIRQWQFFEQSFTLLYAIAGNYRYCGRIGRHHKSNNVTFVVQPARGIYYQKCLDPECHAEGYRSADYLLPFKLEPPKASPENMEVVPAEKTSEGYRTNAEDSDGSFCCFDAEGDELMANLEMDEFCEKDGNAESLNRASCFDAETDELMANLVI